VEGGYRVSGRWKWGTGVMHADWVMLSVMTPGETPARMRMAAIPADQVKVIDVWQVAGMAGTGSNDILAEDVFVPSRHMADFDAMRDGAACGATLHANPLYAMPMLPFLYVGAAIPALGAARRAVASFRSNITDRMVRGTDLKQQDKPAAQMRLARATLTLQTAELLLRDIARRNMTLVGAGPQNVEARIEMRAQGAHVVELCREAVRTVVEASGASVHFLNHPMQRALRDIQVISGHIVFDMDSGLEMLGRSMIGLKPVTPALF
jgi:alkylation response protein AidB-like acyl-CoA dehydrogenase